MRKDSHCHQSDITDEVNSHVLTALVCFRTEGLYQVTERSKRTRLNIWVQDLRLNMVEAVERHQK